jgi:exonuclease SbcC
MSHARTVIEPSAGLTVLIGPNNCGKSAIVSALETLARDTRGDFMVRHGEKLCSVTVETDDGHTITWKRKKSVSYEIDGREVHRVTPDDLHEHLRLPLVTSDRNNDEFEIHFGQQKSPIFLLNEPDSRPATFFSASSDAGRLLEIQDRHRDKRKERTRDRTTCASNIAKLEDQLSRLEGLDSTAEELAKLEAEHVALQKHMRSVATLEAAILKLAEHARLVADYREKCEAFQSLQSPPPIHDLETPQRLVNEFASCVAKASRARDELIATKALQHGPELADDRSLHALIHRIAECVTQHDRQSHLGEALQPLLDAPELVDDRALKEAIAKIMAARIELARPMETTTTLSTLHDPPAMIDPAALEMQWKTINAARSACDQANRRSKEAADALTQVERGIREWVAANPACPVCGGDVSAEKILEGGHAHA